MVLHQASEQVSTWAGPGWHGALQALPAGRGDIHAAGDVSAHATIRRHGTKDSHGYMAIRRVCSHKAPPCCGRYAAGEPVAAEVQEGEG